MTSSPMQSVKISGSGHIGGGHYDTVHVSGSARITGNVICQNVRISGSLHAQGSLECQAIHVSGSTEITDTLVTEDGHISGSLQIRGSLEVRGDLHVSGHAGVEGKASGHSYHISGIFRVGQEIEVDTLICSGTIECPGLISADHIKIDLYHPAKVGELAGASIDVAVPSGRFSPDLIGHWRRRRALLTVDEVSGDDLNLAYTKASLVRGDRIRIGEGCRIDRIEYRETLQADEASWIGESVHVE